MMLNDHGEVAITELRKTGEMTNIGLDCFVVMPNHVHLVAVIASDPGGKNAAPTARAKQRIPVMVQNYKAAVSRMLNFSPWHRSYYDEIIKTQERFECICTYVAQNPGRWGNDRLHPNNFEEYLRKHPL